MKTKNPARNEPPCCFSYNVLFSKSAVQGQNVLHSIPFQTKSSVTLCTLSSIHLQAPAHTLSKSQCLRIRGGEGEGEGEEKDGSNGFLEEVYLFGGERQ